uniref:Uncharacterized protein n=1 Tax=Strongyloides papillosus TaxID=174720 RepID=A0A0N5BU97_STREA
MYSTSFNKVAQIIILMFFISFGVINCEMNSQFSNQLKNAPIRAKRDLSINQNERLFDELHKARENQAKETVTKNYKDTNDPWGYGRK